MDVAYAAGEAQAFSDERARLQLETTGLVVLVCRPKSAKRRIEIGHDTVLDVVVIDAGIDLKTMTKKIGLDACLVSPTQCGRIGIGHDAIDRIAKERVHPGRVTTSNRHVALDVVRPLIGQCYPTCRIGSRR